MVGYRLRNGAVVGAAAVLTRDVAVVGDRLVETDQAGLIDVDVHGLLVAPGFVDLQVNGGFGLDLTEDPASMGQLAHRLPEVGVTAFAPTLVSPSRDVVAAALACPSPTGGARVLGWHLEGPAIAAGFRGTHPLERLVTSGALSTWGVSSSAGVALVTLAPELDGAVELVEALVRSRIVVSMGHSGADAETVRRAVDAGARSVTHLFNAMRPLHHRDVGLAGVGLSDDRLRCGVIVDGVHLSDDAVVLAWRCLGPERFVLVSDAMAAAGLGPGEYRIAGVDVVLDGGVVRNTDGDLAGSASFIDAGVRRLRSVAAVSIPEAVGAATLAPRRVLSLASHGVAVGAQADLVLLDDALEVRATIVGGVVCHDPEGIFGRRLAEVMA